MTTDEVRKKYIEFFENKSHKNIGSAPMVLQNDSTTLFTSSGMQPLIPFLNGEKHPDGVRLVNSQKCIRTQDIEEVGDNRHTTFFEMLGNWSLGDYFKNEQINFVWEFLTDKNVGLGLDKNKLYISVFSGEGEVSRDIESFEIWQNLGVSEDHIFEYGFKKNWWSRSGIPSQMPEGEIGGPDTEIFFDFGEELGLHESSDFKNEKCNPNCDCGRFLEIGNSVFIQYKKSSNGSLEELSQKNVDFGGGLERLVAATNNDPDVFKIDIFYSIIKKIEEISDKKYQGNEKEMRIIADHLRASVALVMQGVEPDNKLQGYILRRLLRRAILKVKNLNDLILNSKNIDSLVENIFENMIDKNQAINSLVSVKRIINVEVSKFIKTLTKGLSEASKIENIDGEKAFNLYQTYGFPLELTREMFEEKGQKINREEFEKAFNEHKDKSKTASAGMFKGGLADSSAETTALHTATHLLHKALREILGNGVSQKGSNITNERLRFDFSFERKLTEEEIAKVENLINLQIDNNLKVKKEMMSLEEAKSKGALAFFGEKYGENVSVYTIFNDKTNEEFSKEVCGGPHVNSLDEMPGHVRIIKQEKLGANIVRVYANFTKK